MKNNNDYPIRMYMGAKFNGQINIHIEFPKSNQDDAIKTYYQIKELLKKQYDICEQ